MLNKRTLDSIRSGSDTAVYSQVTNVAVYMATGGFLEAANQLLSELWKYRLPHERDTWLADTALMVLWEAAGNRPDFIPFPLADIESIEKNIRQYIAIDRWVYKMPDKPWSELKGQDLLRKAYITAGMESPFSMEGILDSPTGTDPEDSLNNIAEYINSVLGQPSDDFPSSATELEALAIIEKLAEEKFISCEGYALGAELAARQGETERAIRLAKIWVSGYHENQLSYLFPLLASGRHVAPLLLQKVIAAELNLSETIVQEFLLEITAVLDKRLQQGRMLLFSNLTWKELLLKIKQRLSKS